MTDSARCLTFKLPDATTLTPQDLADLITFLRQP